jgi:exodeoxyribonuclease VII large subunit
LRQLLTAEGLFAAERKLRLPFLPHTIGLITGRASAAEHDVLENTRRRLPGARFAVENTATQGTTAVTEIIAALQRLDARPEVEVIVIARGGGSVEDLLPFSNEALLRAVAAARTPVVSAIGHESDNPILDLVADYRASTPTDAAKRIVPDAADERARIQQARQRLAQAITGQISRQQEILHTLRSRPVLADPTASLGLRTAELGNLRERARRAIEARLDREQLAVRHDLDKIRAVSPQATLERGYAILVGARGQPVNSVGQADVGEDMVAHLADGQLVVAVREVRARGGT